MLKAFLAFKGKGCRLSRQLRFQKGSGRLNDPYNDHLHFIIPFYTVEATSVSAPSSMPNSFRIRSVREVPSLK